MDGYRYPLNKSKDVTGGGTLTQENAPQLDCWSRLWHGIVDPDIVQPSLLMISLVYVLHMIFVNLGQLPEQTASTYFGYFCGMLAFGTSVMFYTIKIVPSPSARITLMRLHWTLLTLLLGLYIGYWFFNPIGLEDPDITKPPNKSRILVCQNSPNQTDTNPPCLSSVLNNNLTQSLFCVEKAKCSNPVHMSLQAAFLGSLIVSILGRLFAS